MVNPLALLGVLPKLEGFAPLPISTMIPFMEAQSASLAYSFGLNYEYGKRKIKSMSNEEFNALTTENIASMANQHTSVQMEHLQAVIPKSMDLQKEIMDMHKQIELEKVDMNVQIMKELPQAYWDAIFETTEKAEEATGTSQETVGGRTPGGSREGGDTNIEDAPQILPGIPDSDVGGRSPGSTSTPSETSEPAKSTNDILQEEQAQRLWENVTGLLLQIEQSIGFRDKYSPGTVAYENHQKKIDQFQSEIDRDTELINEIQMNHLENFGHYITLL